MKKTKVLVPALGILCLSMAASITSTVAWFSANAEVTAKGMKISAATDTSLVINQDPSAAWLKTVTMASDKADVVPVSPIIVQTDGTKVAAGLQSMTEDVKAGANDIRTTTNFNENITFYRKGENNEVPDVADEAADVTFSEFLASDAEVSEDSFMQDTTEANIAKEPVYLKLIAAPGVKQQTKLKITVTSALFGGREIDKALHIGFLTERNAGIQEGETELDEGTSMDRVFRQYDLTSFATKPTYTSSTPSDAAAAFTYENEYTNWMELEAEKPVRVTVYAWYDGEDGDCTSKNANIVNELSIDLSWSKYTEDAGA